MPSGESSVKSTLINLIDTLPLRDHRWTVTPMTELLENQYLLVVPSLHEMSVEVARDNSSD